MNVQDLRSMVESTSDPAFAVDDNGVIIAWNDSATELTGRSRDEVIGQQCGTILCGSDECGPVCSDNCTVRQAVQRRKRIRNFDLQIATRLGPQWCNISVLIAENTRSIYPYAIHIMRPIDATKRLELTVRDFVSRETATKATARTAACDADLTPRERQVLQLMATGARTASIAQQLHVSKTTLNNHIQHILHKLNCHSRLEAVRRAERAGLI